LELPLIQDPADDVNELMEQYDRGLASLLDKHAPLKKSVITIQPENFWSSELVEEARRRARVVERRWISRRLEIDKQLLRDARDLLTLLFDEAKTKQLSRMILDCGADRRNPFRAVGDRLLVKPARKLPEHDSLH
jgi:hypothetical protein